MQYRLGYPDVCYGSRVGVGTYARYGGTTASSGSITSIAIRKIATFDQFLFVADSGSNAIRSVELTSGLYVMTSFDSFNSTQGPPSGLAVYGSTFLYCAVPGGVYKYLILTGGSSRTKLAGTVNSNG